MLCTYALILPFSIAHFVEESLQQGMHCRVLQVIFERNGIRPQRRISRRTLAARSDAVVEWMLILYFYPTSSASIVGFRNYQYMNV